ncbi:MAG: hypothetical protein K8M05_29985 [Deltaproteobacteria bacterium]|nr:hypothetical protein [Kofleriaceae bacterium]
MKRILVFVAVTLAALVACGGKKLDSYDDLLAKMQTFTRDMCKCTDETCADKVYDGMGAWASSQIETIQKAKPTPQQQQAMRELEDELKACRAKASGS